MRNSRLALGAIALVSGASLLFTGCSGSPEVSEEDNPLWEYFSAFDSGEEWTDERFEEQEKAQQESIAACMSKQGFEYTPDVQTAGISFSEEVTEEDGPEWGTVEFAKEYGYGIVAWPDSMGGEEDFVEYVDPNEDYINSLSESEQMAFYDALHGPSPTEEEYELMEEEDNYEWNPENQGCWGEAMDETNADPAADLYDDPEFADLFESLDLLWSNIESDDRIVTMNRDWVACMSEAGFTAASTRDETQNQLYDEWYATTDELNANMGEFDEWQEPSQAEKDEFQLREIEIATADFSCAEKLDWDDTYIAVDHDLSQQFVDTHKAQLDAMVAKYGQR